jgi:hypothetical protein
MKMIVTGVAFATLMATPVFAQPQRNEGSLASDIYQSARKSNQPTSTPDTMDSGRAVLHTISVPTTTTITAEAKSFGARRGNRPLRHHRGSAFCKPATVSVLREAVRRLDAMISGAVPRKQMAQPSAYLVQAHDCLSSTAVMSPSTQLTLCTFGRVITRD